MNHTPPSTLKSKNLKSRTRSLSTASLLDSRDPLTQQPPWSTDPSPKIYRIDPNLNQPGHQSFKPPGHDDLILPTVARQIEKQSKLQQLAIQPTQDPTFSIATPNFSQWESLGPQLLLRKASLKRSESSHPIESSTPIDLEELGVRNSRSNDQQSLSSPDPAQPSSSGIESGLETLESVRQARSSSPSEPSIGSSTHPPQDHHPSHRRSSRIESVRSSGYGHEPSRGSMIEDRRNSRRVLDPVGEQQSAGQALDHHHHHQSITTTTITPSYPPFGAQRAPIDYHPHHDPTPHQPTSPDPHHPDHHDAHDQDDHPEESVSSGCCKCLIV